MKSVKGVGPAAISTVIAELPEFGELNRGQIAKLVGGAPINHDSGQHQGKRKTLPEEVPSAECSIWPPWWQRVTIRAAKRFVSVCLRQANRKSWRSWLRCESC